MLSMSTVRGNGPNFTFLTVFLPVHPLAVLLSPCAARSFTAITDASHRANLRGTHRMSHSLLPHHPDCTSHKDSTASWRGAQQGQRTDFRTIPVLLSLYTVTVVNVSDLQHNPTQCYPTITYGFPMDYTQRT